MPDFARLPIPNDSFEWKRVQAKLSRSLPGAKLTNLERVQNQHAWDRFYRKCQDQHEDPGCHMDFTRQNSAVKELWHATGAVDAICESKIGYVGTYSSETPCRICVLSA